MKLVQFELLYNFTLRLLKKVDLDDFSAESVAFGLCESSIRGVDSHGIRLLPHYVNSALSGRKNKNPQFKFTKKYPSIGLLDADDAFGHSAGMKAIDLCMEMADENGIGVVGVCNSSHPGALGSFSLRAARKGYIAMSLTHADSLMLSHGGKRAFFGTNPFCVAIPREGGEYCLDMATTMIPWNKVLLYKENSFDIEPNLVADEDGEATKDLDRARYLMPAGGHKGYGLASMVEIFCSVFTGMKFGREIPSMYKTSMNQPRKLGQFYLVFKADGCIEHQDFIQGMKSLTEQVHLEPARGEEKVMLPGDKELKISIERKKSGIPIDESLFTKLKNLSAEYNIQFEV